MNSTVIPCLRYRDAPYIVDWLCNTFGFKRHAVYEDGEAERHLWHIGTYDPGLRSVAAL
jgi:uncharacterized glyoxalase superfamily protein PhnB